MKNYNEIANTIFERRDEYLAQQKAKRKKITQITSAVACFVLVAGIGFGMNMDKWVRTQLVEPSPTLLTTLVSDTEVTDNITATAGTDNLTVDDKTQGGTMTTSPTTHNENATQPVTGNEAVFSEIYVYNVSEGEFSTYVSGKVISENNIESKIGDVSVSAGWKNSFGEWLTTETLRAEIYLISDISRDVAVALKFIDKGDALTTTHYYVIMNPESDLTSVKEYLIAPIQPNNIGDETVGEVAENELAGEYVVEYTSQFTNE